MILQLLNILQSTKNKINWFGCYQQVMKGQRHLQIYDTGQILKRWKGWRRIPIQVTDSSECLWKENNSTLCLPSLFLFSLWNETKELWNEMKWKCIRTGQLIWSKGQFQKEEGHSIHLREPLCGNKNTWVTHNGWL